MRSLGRTRENGRFRGSFSESDREVRRRSKVLWKVGTMVWRNAYMSLIFSPLPLSVSWLASVLVCFLEVEVRVVVEQGDLSSVVVVLESYRRALLETVSARARGGLYVALGAKLKKMQEMMANGRIYEAFRMAYVLSGLSHTHGKDQPQPNQCTMERMVQSDVCC